MTKGLRRCHWGETAKQFVVCGENVLDLGTEFRFLKREGVEKNGRVWNVVGASFEFGNRPAGASGSLEDGRGLQLGFGR